MAVLQALFLVLLALLFPTLLRAARAIKQLARVHWLTRGIPQPRSHPIIGNLLAIISAKGNCYQFFREWRIKYGGLSRLWLFNYIAVVVTDAEDVEVVCTHPALQTKAPQYHMLCEHMGQGLVTLPYGSDYRRHRKAISPSLHFEILQNFIPIFAKNAMDLTKLLDEKATVAETFNITSLLGVLSNSTITQTVLSTRLTGSSQELEQIVQAVDQSSQLTFDRAIRPWLENDWLFCLSSMYLPFKQSAATIHKVVVQILEQKTQEVRKETEPTAKRRMSFLDHMLRSAEGATITKNELTSELQTMLFAGSLTSMDFLSLFAVILTVHPNVQEKIQEELDEIFGEDDERPVEPEDIPHMEYMERALKEALRIVPPVPMISRDAAADVTLPSGFVIPRGCSVTMVPAVTHRNPRFFPDPERFDPDRFLPENTRGRHPFAYIPFSAGVRSCLGQRYAMMFAKATLATVLRKVTFVRAPDGPSSLNDLDLKVGISMSIIGGAHVRVERRLKAFEK